MVPSTGISIWVTTLPAASFRVATILMSVIGNLLLFMTMADMSEMPFFALSAAMVHEALATKTYLSGL
jgi:hypothetical protein